MLTLSVIELIVIGIVFVASQVGTAAWIVNTLRKLPPPNLEDAVVTLPPHAPEDPDGYELP